MSTERRKLRYVYDQMRKRCYEPRNKSYKNYGARGIGVCRTWLDDIETFIRDMGPRPPGMSLERIDNNQGYFPSNCTWADAKQQASNRRFCTYLDDSGEKVTVKEFCRRRQLPYRAVMKRYRYRGWTLEQAVTIPFPGRKP